MSVLPDGTVDYATIAEAQVHTTAKGTVVVSLTLMLENYETRVFHHIQVPHYTQLMWATGFDSVPEFDKMVGRKVFVTLGVSQYGPHQTNTVTSIRKVDSDG